MMENYNIVEDVSLLTNISAGMLSKIISKGIWAMSFDLSNSADKQIAADIGFGMLYIHCDNDEIVYKFMPSKELEKSLTQAVVNGPDSVTNVVEQTLAARIKRAYKELF